MVFHRVLSFRRSSRSADGRVENLPSGKTTTSTSSKQKNKVEAVKPHPPVSSSSPNTLRTVQTCSPADTEWSYADSAADAWVEFNSPSRPPPPPSSTSLPAPATRQHSPLRSAMAAQLSSAAHSWMRILPLEEKKENNNNSDDQTGSSVRRCRTGQQVPSIVHAGHPIPHIPKTPGRIIENPFEEYEEEDDIIAPVGRYVRSVPLMPPQPSQDEDEQVQIISPCPSTLQNDDGYDTFSQTIVAGNVIMTSSVLLLSSVISLSVLKHADTMLLNPHASDNPFEVRPPNPGSMANPQKFLFAPPASKTVRDSLKRHIYFHLSRSHKTVQPVNDDMSRTLSREFAEMEAEELGTTVPPLTPATPVTEDAPLPPLTPSTVHNVVYDCLVADNIGAAISVYQAYLAKQNAIAKGSPPDSIKTPSSSFSTPERSYSYHSTVSHSVAENMDAQRADTLSKLAVLSLLAGQTKESMQYATKAAHLHKENNNRPLSTAMATMLVGLIHFATSRAGRALKAWREAMQLCCLAVGYDHPIVAVLLNNIGVLHYDSGDSIAAIRALEESLELQRSMLKSGLAAVHVDHALNQMATTMGNLALALELSERYDRAIALLQESYALFESVENEVTTDNESSADGNATELVQENLDRVLLLREGFLARTRNEESLLQTESNSMGDASTTDGDRSTTIFGNADGIPIKNGAKHVMSQLDNHDYLLLGLVSKELTPRQRVREIVLTWFGRASDEMQESVVVERTPFVPFETVVNRDAEDLADLSTDVNTSMEQADKSSTIGQPTSPDRSLNRSEAEPDAMPDLRQVHSQALEHLDHHEIGDALDLFVSCLNAIKSRYGDQHHLVGTALHNIGMVHLFAEEYLQAYGIFKEAARIRAVALGHEHPDVASSMIKIGLLQYAAMDIAAASRTFSEVREIYLSSMGYAHPYLARIMNNIGVLRYEEGDFTGATRAFEIAYEYQRRLVEEHPGDSAVAEIAMGFTLANIGFLYHRQDELVSAVQLFEEARSTLMRHLFAHDPKVMMVQENIEYLVGKGVDIGAPCEEGCQMTPAARSCLMQLAWIRR